MSHRFAVPTGEVIPGLKVLLVRDADPVMLSVMSDILTIHGEEHGTRAFHEPEPVGNWGAVAPVCTNIEVTVTNDSRVLARRKTVTLLA